MTLVAISPDIDLLEQSSSMMVYSTTEYLHLSRMVKKGQKARACVFAKISKHAIPNDTLLGRRMKIVK